MNKLIGQFNWKKAKVSIDRYMNISIDAPHRITLYIPYTLSSVYPAPAVKEINDRLLKKIRLLLKKENFVGDFDDEIWTWNDIVIYHTWANVHTIEQWESFCNKQQITNQWK